ncbi:hypothetical protein [Bacillus thuringiensis]|uniref:hypothetical protein n=1 Tax=Bacillus thuringiensis TaxID=1428 RepID=UPI000BFD23B8|nr:hypothetical protein [Bacillus thuringiensis]PGT89933.1 hypothetical protein COD17_09290 [Bacillus thuringiensis]
MLKRLLKLGAKTVQTAVTTGADLQYKKIETKFRVINLGLKLGITAIRLTSKVAIAGAKGVYRGTRAVGEMVRSKPASGGGRTNRRENNAFDFGHSTPATEEKPKQGKLERDEWRDTEDTYQAYDFHTPTEQSKPPTKPAEREKKVDEREKLSAIDPEKAEILERLQREGIIGKPKESLLDGIYDGDKRFKDAFMSKSFPKNVSSMWDELNYTLKVTFHVSTPITLHAKEDGLYYPNQTPLFIYGQGGKEGDMSVALTRFLQDVPQSHANVLIELLYEYKGLAVGSASNEDVQEVPV